MDSASGITKAVVNDRKYCFKEQKQVQYKIKYTLNRLPLFSTKKKHLIDALLQTREDDVFRTQVVKDFSSYHWSCYGKYPILAGLVFHIIYITLMILYIDQYYQLKVAIEDC